METIVAKFGGSSLKDQEGIGRLETIMRDDERRRVIVVSAPGGSPKVTRLLKLLAAQKSQHYERLISEPEYGQKINDRFLLEVVSDPTLTDYLNNPNILDVIKDRYGQVFPMF